MSEANQNEPVAPEADTTEPAAVNLETEASATIQAAENPEQETQE